MARAFWWQGSDSLGHVVNLGDALNPLLLTHYGIDATWSPIADAIIVACGSVLDQLQRSGFTGTIAGAGQLQESTTTDLTDATVLGLRGFLTKERVRCNGFPIIGDPGLLAPQLAAASPGTINIGVIPHWTDTELWERGRCEGAVLIDVRDDPLDVIAQIGSCNRIVSSALHGIIIADAFGIPRRAEPFLSMRTNKWEGGGFKWADYGSSIGQPVEFSQWQQAPTRRITQMQSDLTAMFQQVKEIHVPAQSR